MSTQKLTAKTTAKKQSFRAALLITLAICFSVAVIASCLLYSRYYYKVHFTPGSFAETSEKLDNPYRGWYHLYGYQLSDLRTFDTTLDTATTQKHIKESSDNRLVLLEINLCEYQNRELSGEALTMLESILSSWKDTSCSMILRFLYDWNGAAAQTEPQSVVLIQRHMKQCADVVNRFKDHVYMLQGVFVGNYGEMHGSIHLEEDDLRSLADQLAAVIDPSIFLAVRTPQHWRMIHKRFTPLSEEEAFSNSPAARFGIFNDGMLGSKTDLDSYNWEERPVFPAASAANDFTKKGSRKEELDFQDALCTYVPNGGEAVIDNPYNDLPQAIEALSKTHVSYLNCDYDSAVLDKWKRSVYESGLNSKLDSKDCFEGMDGYEYIGRHLGYRYFVADTELSQPNGRLQLHPATLSLTVKNSGFSGCPRKFQAMLTLKKAGTKESFPISVETDTRLWKAGNSIQLSIPLDIPDLGNGEYDIYWKLSDRSDVIQFANSLPFDSQYGYKIAHMEVSKGF